ncbi:hypothetical protein JOQ06_005063, partial [Pogonophryne albipinna]
MHPISINRSSDDFQVDSGVWANMARKWGSLTFNPSPLCGCESQPMQVRMCGVSCPKVHEGGGVVVYYPQCQRAAEYRCSQGVRGMMEEKGGRQNEWRKRE